MSRMSFGQIFRRNEDGSIEPLRVVRVGPVQFGPGVRFGSGVVIGGLDLSQYVGRDFEINEQRGDGTLIITGIY